MDQNLDYCEPNIKVYTINDRIVAYRMMCTEKKEERKKISSTSIPVAIASSFLFTFRQTQMCIGKAILCAITICIRNGTESNKANKNRHRDRE